MATTFNTLVDEIEADLQDSGNATWTAADILRWLRAAIREYSDFFPRLITDAIGTTADVRTYDLEAGFVNPISVEYPTSQDPPQYLQQRPYTHPDFWQEEGYYAIAPIDDDTDLNQIHISTKPADSETITVIYEGIHDSSSASTNNVTVPQNHHHILKAYARWKAVIFLAAAEEASPTSNSSLLMSQLASNGRRYEREYKNALAQAIQAYQGRSKTISWANFSSENTRIY